MLTSVTAKPVIEALLRSYESRSALEVEVIALTVHSIAAHTAESIRRLVEKIPGLRNKLREFDVVMVPGTVEGDLSVLEASLAKPRVVKGPRSPALISVALNAIAQGLELSRVESVEEHLRHLKLEAERAQYTEAFKIGAISVPLRGPPMLLASEIPFECPRERLEREARRVSWEGADIVVVGASYEASSEELAERVAVVKRSTGRPVLAEAPSVEHAEKALVSGADGVLVAASTARELSETLRAGVEPVIVIGDRDLRALENAARVLAERGFTKIAIDPVVGVPLFDLASSMSRYLGAASLNYPLVFSASNALAELPADTHGAQALLAMIAAELRASIYSVVDREGRLAHATAEAREALRVAHEIHSGRRVAETSGLFIVKSPTPPVSEKLPYSAELVDYVEPRWDKRGYLRILVDHDEGVLVAYYIEYSGRVYGVKGRHAMSVARGLIRLTGIDSEHSAYLGYELAKAELALKLSKSYIQDEDLLGTPWSRKEGVASRRDSGVSS
ncbi:MAG: dihydropteroate synthase-like protein [Acidilobaceae archaeon]